MTPMKLLQDAMHILKIKDTHSLENSSEKGISIKTSNGKLVNCFIPAALYIGQQSLDKSFVGLSKEDEACVYQWLEYCLLNLNQMENRETLAELNTFLKNNVYFARKGLTIADLIIYLSLHEIFSKLTFQEKETYCNLSRWFRQVQNDTCAYDLYPKIVFTKTKLYT